jgi:hypothetical protein
LDFARYIVVTPLLEMVKDWREFLLSGIHEKEIEELRKHERTGRPLGSEGFVEKVERTLNRILQNKNRGERKEIRRIEYGVPRNAEIHLFYLFLFLAVFNFSNLLQMFNVL